MLEIIKGERVELRAVKRDGSAGSLLAVYFPATDTLELASRNGSRDCVGLLQLRSRYVDKKTEVPA